MPEQTDPFGKGVKMSTTITISDKIAHHLNRLPGNGSTIEVKFSVLIEGEYRRRLARYRLTDANLSRKYGMSFAEFEEQRVTEREGYSWEVEQDAIAWETAVDGIATVERQLRDLQTGT